MAVDPVCGMTIDEESAAHRLQHEGMRYCFCSAQCLNHLEARLHAFQRLAGDMGDAAGVIGVLDVPGVAGEVPQVLQRVTDALALAQARRPGAQPVDIVLLAHRYGVRGIEPRAVLPISAPAGRKKDAHPPLLTLLLTGDSRHA